MIVQKYGGSSVGTPEKIRNVAARIAQARQAGQSVVVVVSAMGDTTDELIELAHQVTTQPLQKAHERELDMLLSAGERISMALLSMALRDLGAEAISFTGSQAGIITDESHTRARIIDIRPFRVLEEVKKGRVVIIAGFQGVSRMKEITTLGRGGSDTTAVALAAALKADRCEVLTDVPGVFSADPRVVSGARRYERLPLDLVFEMAAKGAQVMHARSIEIVRERGFPIYVGLAHPPRGASCPSEEGTMIVPRNPEEHFFELPKVVAVVAKKGLKALRFSAAASEQVMGEFSREGLSVQGLTLTNAGGLCVLVDATEAAAFLARHPAAVEPSAYSAVSVIGYQMQQNAVIPARIAELFKAQGIALAGLTCHPQSITVWFAEKDERAVGARNNGEHERAVSARSISQSENLADRAVKIPHDHFCG